MIKYLLGMFLVLGASLTASAQKGAIKTVTIPTPTVQCGMCEKKIEQYLAAHDGVISSAVNIKGKKTVVKYIVDRTNEENIKAMIANAGYDAGDYKANPETYKALPVCCKKPEDGGGM